MWKILGIEVHNIEDKKITEGLKISFHQKTHYKDFESIISKEEWNFVIKKQVKAAPKQEEQN
jgi:hypothetical protein